MPTMTRSKTAQAEVNADTAPPAPEMQGEPAVAGGSEQAADGGTEKSGIVVPVPHTLKSSSPDMIEISELNYVTFCWPDIDDEDDAGEDDDDDDDDEDDSENEWVTEDEDDDVPPAKVAKNSSDNKKPEAEKGSSTVVNVRRAKCGTKSCKCNKPLEKSPRWPIFLTKEGAKYMFYVLDQNKRRNQANFGIYIYNDWSGWGTAEVLTNTLVKFNKYISEKERSPAKRWAVVEGLGMLLSSYEQLQDFLGNEDGPGNSEIVEMIGTMLLTCLEMLQEANLLSTDSPIKNVGFISMLYMNFAIGTWLDIVGDDGLHGEAGWTVPVVRYLDKHGIEIPCLDVTKAVNEEMLVKLRSEAEALERGGAYQEAAAIEAWTPKQDFDKAKEVRLWHRWDWTEEWRTFCRKHKGGRHYDLAFMPAAEKRRYRIR